MSRGSMKSSENTIGLYIHWPYCLSKCPYCDFASSVCRQIDEDTLLSGYIRDMDNLLNGLNVSTIFFGGGTPSLMSVGLCEKILNEIEKRIGLTTVSEITMEANPDAIDLPKMKAFNQLGINRLSLGVQALNEKDLHFLGRKHSVQTALKRIEEAQQVFNKINMD
jgi:oxygen-independent coproporphyrinogen-3 oxidase